MFILYGQSPVKNSIEFKKTPEISYSGNNFFDNSTRETAPVFFQNKAVNNAVAGVTNSPEEFVAAEEAKEKLSEAKDVFLNVPFTAQAPLGNWADPMQQNGCEEISAIMAMAWVKGEEKLVPEEVINEIRKISNYELENYGSYIDTNVADTVERIFKGYFKYNNVEIRNEIGMEDIKQELFKGNLVIVPANGRILANPNYTPPGPETHMLLIIGYDSLKKEFITNDGGTRQGKNFRFKEDIMEEAILDYPTGSHEPIIEIKKAMIVVKK